MTKKEKQNIIIFSLIYYVIAIAFMIVGTINDLEIDKKLFSPQNNFGIMMNI